jgi:CBS domain-containing protein
MLVNDILERKGRDVATVGPDDPVSTAVERLRHWGVGALVVTADGISIDGIVSERDIVRSLGREPEPALLDQPTRAIMTAEVITCSPTDRVERLMSMMTGRRIRHLPVTIDDRLHGIISIGDVVKSRLEELENEARALEQYIHHGR